jgi:hypothetical protein
VAIQSVALHLRNLLHLGGNVDYTTKRSPPPSTGPTAHESPAPFSF